MKIVKYIVFAACAFLFTSCSDTTVRHMENYEQRLRTGSKVVILPPAVEVETLDYAGNKERMYDYELKMESVIANELKPILEEKGFSSTVLTRREIHEKGLGEKIEKLREAYHHIREELYLENLWSKDKASSIEKKVTQDLKGITDAPFLVFVDYVGVSKTTGAKFFEGALSVFGLGKSGYADANIMTLGIVDTATGEVVWTNTGQAASGMMSAMWDSMLPDEEVDSNIAKTLIIKVLSNMNLENN